MVVRRRRATATAEANKIFEQSDKNKVCGVYVLRGSIGGWGLCWWGGGGVVEGKGRRLRGRR